MARPQPYRAARIRNRDKTITIRLRKSSSPSRWLMGLPPTSPRLKFIHAHPGGSPVPRRPPRHPPSPSIRSRSLELLDQDEKKSILPASKPEPLPRPRSRSLDGLLDEDGMVPEMKTEDSSKSQNDEAKSNVKETPECLDRLSDTTKSSDTDDVCARFDEAEDKTEVASDLNTHLCTVEHEGNSSDTKSNEDQNPMPVPRGKVRPPSVELKLESAKIVQQEDTRISSSSEDASDKEDTGRPMRPPKPNRHVSLDGQMSSSKKNEMEDSETCSEAVDPCDSNVESPAERLTMTTTGNDKSTLLKAKSCGAGLDSDESISSNEYKPKVKGQGSLLSLPTGAEPKRKKNFMDKCVNKVRSFMRK